MKINLYYWNNGVGVLNDAILIKTILSEYDVIPYDISKPNQYRQSDLGIFIQNVQIDQFSNNKKNIFIINEEWLSEYEISQFNKFDYLLVKSNYAKQLLSLYHSNIIKIGFFSLDRYSFPRNTKKILHFKGKSIQKNSELIYDYKDDIKILDSEIEYLSESQIDDELNNHDVHICCSLYEAWGHYLWEAIGCGKLVICSEIPVFKEYLDPELVKFVPTEKIVKYDSDHRFLKELFRPFRQGYYVNKMRFEDLLHNKEELFEFQKKNCYNIRQHFLHVNNINKQKFLETIKFIL